VGEVPGRSPRAWLTLGLLGALLVGAAAGGSVLSGLNGREAAVAADGREAAPGAAAGQTAGDRGAGEEAPSPPPALTGEGWGVLVDVSAQKVYVYQGGKLARTMVCSTGTADNPTPRGEFRIQNRGTWFFSEKYQQGGRWWVSFHNWGEYLFHSVPTDREGRILPEEAARLGQPASHGCVRLSTEDAEWFYHHVPEGAPVIIR